MSKITLCAFIALAGTAGAHVLDEATYFWRFDRDVNGDGSLQTTEIRDVRYWGSTNVNGYAGNGKPIDAIEVYYDTPSSVVKRCGWLKAKYRVAPIGNYYFPWQYDDETSSGQDGYAGEFGRRIDWFQMTLSD